MISLANRISAAALLAIVLLGLAPGRNEAAAQALFDAVGQTAKAVAQAATPPAGAQESATQESAPQQADPQQPAPQPPPATTAPADPATATPPATQTQTPPAADAPAAQPAAAPAAAPQPAPDNAADQATIAEIREPSANLRATIDTLETDVDASRENDENLARLRLEIDGLIGASDQFLESLQPRYRAIASQIEKLGPLPAKDQPAEAPAIQAERQRLSFLSAEIDGAIKATGLVQYRARELLTRVQEYRTGIFTTQLFRRNASPLSLDTWTNVAEAMPPAWTELNWTVWRWRRSAENNLFAIFALLGGAAAIYIALARIRRRVFAARLDAPIDTEPDFFKRAGTAGWVASLTVLPPALALSLIAFGFDNLGLWFLDSGRIVFTVLPAALVFIAVRALAHAILQPKRPQWRLIDLDDRPAASLTSAMTWIGAVYAIDLLAKEAIRILAMPLSVSVATATIASVTLAALLFKIVRTPFTRRPPRPRDTEQPSDALTAVPKDAPPNDAGPFDVTWLAPKLLKIPLLAVALFILGASLAGYVALGRFVSGQVIVTGSVVVLAILLHLAIRALIETDSTEQRALGRVMNQRLGLDDHQSRTVTKVAAFALDGLLALVALPFILVTWGFALPDTLAWLKSLVFGFEIGHVRISLVQIAAAVALFAALLFVTRLVQRWISGTFLSTARVDPGLANSIHKAIGYAGFALAVLVALSYAGLDITNIAIVAGALSVGIGFGLQSIINNFVSGLILLFERPLKVGDLIVVAGQTGRVRNISVRSTEIETGDRATLIVPNSELITNSFLNWTHRNALSSISIPVKTSYAADPDHVRTILDKVAADCPLILQQPKPGASFDAFGPNGFEFTLSASVADFGKRGAATSDLRHRIVRAFREAGIEMPYAQHDVHLRDLDFVKTLVQRVQEVRAAETAQKPAAPDEPPPPAPTASTEQSATFEFKKRK
jgi:small-conductance mechanosensitive channel